MKKMFVADTAVSFAVVATVAGYDATLRLAST